MTVDSNHSRSKLSAAQNALLEQRLKGKLKKEKRAGAPIPRRSSNPAPLSYAQQRLWFLYQLNPTSPFYNWYHALQLNGPLDVTALKRSFNELVRRHEVLRATFPRQDGQPVQVAAPALTVELPVIDLRRLPQAESQAEARRLAIAEARRPFILEEGPLIRLKLLRLDEQEHWLLLTMHHIISDNWSDGVIWSEIERLYAAFLKETPPALPEPPLQYADFAVWQRQQLSGAMMERQRAYWQKQLGGEPPALQLPADHPRPAVQTFEGARRSSPLPATLTRALTMLARQTGATLFMTLLAAFKVLLHRYTRQRDVIVGTPISNRNRPELEELIGFFLNTLLLRTDLSGEPTFRETLGRVRDVCLEAYTHQDLPFEKLVEVLKPERDLSYNPLFQVLFVLLDQAKPDLRLPHLDTKFLDISNDTVQFDLTMFIETTPEGLLATVGYNTALFEADTIERMLGHFQVLLEGIAANPDLPISNLPLLPAAERNQLLNIWAGTSVAYPAHRLIHQIFEDQVAKTPQATALSFEGEQTTYAALNERANRLAHYLQQQGVNPGAPVGIYMDRCPELVIAILGVLKAGGVYTPLDPVYPAERIAFILDDTQAPVLLTHRPLREKLPATEAQVVYLDSDWETIAATGSGVDRPAVTLTVDAPAYIIYTSGSTGRPKGVVVTHYNVVRLFLATEAWYNFNDKDVWTLFHSCAFDFSVWEMWGALLYGGRLVIVPYLTSRSPEAFYRLLAREQATVLNQTPSAFRQLMRVEAETAAQDELALRLVIFGGEALDLNSLRPWFERHGDQTPRLVNMYGITETTVHVTYRPLTIADVEAGRGSLIGRPISDLQLYILDRRLQPVPIGAPGEMYVGGAGLAAGYLNRPELTAERFIPHPFSDDPQARLYKTGDLARYLPDQDIEYLGRIDDQVKIRGFRIELGEIEAWLNRRAGLHEAAVVVQEDGAGDKRLIAYYTTVPGTDPVSAAHLRDFLKKNLPDYMLPAAFVPLEQFPLTANGKLDRRRLPAADQVALSGRESFSPPGDLLELQLTQIWEQLLQISPIGVRDNFFEIGGQSLLAVRLLGAIEKTTNRKLSLATLFQAPTIEQLAQILRQDGWTAPSSAVVAIRPEGDRPPFFCVPGNLGNVFTDLGILARYLPADQPFYGLQDSVDLPTRIEALAARYIEAIRAIRPDGPYLLGGICSGGLIAYEIAQQLKRQGREVRLLALIESFPEKVSLRGYYYFFASTFRRFIRRFGRQSQQAAEVGLAEQSAFLRLKAKVIGNMWGVTRYAPRPYPGRADLFFTAASLEAYRPAVAWGHLATEGIEVHPLPGVHDTITGDNGAEIDETAMQALAEQLAARIETAMM